MSEEDCKGVVSRIIRIIKAMKNIHWDICQECPNFISEDSESLYLYPNRLLNWCTFIPKDLNYCGIMDLILIIKEDYNID